MTRFKRGSSAALARTDIGSYYGARMQSLKPLIPVESKPDMAWEKTEVLEALRFGEMFIVHKLHLSGDYLLYPLKKKPKTDQLETIKRRIIRRRLPLFRTDKGVERWAKVGDIIFVSSDKSVSIIGETVSAEDGGRRETDLRNDNACICDEPPISENGSINAEEVARYAGTQGSTRDNDTRI